MEMQKALEGFLGKRAKFRSKLRAVFEGESQLVVIRRLEAGNV